MLPENSNQKGKTPSALSRAVERLNKRRQPVRIGFVIDATGSRDNSWEQAQVGQGQMFRAAARLRSLSLRLIHFGGNQLIDHGWSGDPKALAAKMAAVRCRTGLTQICEALSTLVGEPKGARASAITLIGDCIEEDADEAEHLAHQLKYAGIKIFAFHEGEDWTAASVFKRLAEITGGRFARFGEELPLSDLCQGVALLTAGGKSGLERLPNKRARQLLLTGPAHD